MMRQRQLERQNRHMNDLSKDLSAAQTESNNASFVNTQMEAHLLGQSHDSNYNQTKAQGHQL